MDFLISPSWFFILFFVIGIGGTISCYGTWQERGWPARIHFFGLTIVVVSVIFMVVLAVRTYRGI